MSAPRKHAAVIHAFADGAAIQYRKTGTDLWTNHSGGSIGWHDDFEYRVKPDPMPAFPLRPGTRVWCYPGTPSGFEATVVADPAPNHPGRVKVRRTDGFHDIPLRSEVVLFDENHNQKRAYAQGKTIQCRLKASYPAPTGLPATINLHEWHDCVKGTDCGEPIWSDSCDYRIKPDPLAEIKAAYVAGKPIEARFTSLRYAPHTGPGPRWHRVDQPRWSSDHEYRIAPVKVQPLKFNVVDAEHEAMPIVVTLDVTKTGCQFTDVKVREFK